MSNLELEELLDAIHMYARDDSSSEPAIMLSANIHGINQAYKYQWLLRMNNNAELVRNDSAGIQLAGKILGIPIKERMTWADFGWDLAEYCEREGLTMYFLGNEEGIAQKAKDELLKKYPALKIVGTYHGFFKKEGEENQKVLEDINRLKPDILVVGFGMPLQERWILKNRSKLDVGIIMTGGNCFNFLAGTESRAPEWMHKNGLEWLFRFLKEPVRMFDRYIIGNPVFLLRVFRQKLFKRSTSSS
ncbi:WecB/TagA/CpsF family glycosyltransferase [Halalkalibaculum sp. DA3122]|uniref:WecB/TagA/CpsF family glycosyltransferase n=1 Tax=Halalkalibaculum sp. DA3122 TaxID=3373607 RepID=UPI003754F65C